jgi:hypothetical protein
MPTQLQLWHFVDVAVGLTFCYLLLGLVASSFKETVSGLMNWRGKKLREALKVLLDHTPDTVRTGESLFKAVFHHGLICPDPHDRAPSYIAARNFSAALTSALVDGPGTRPLLEQVATGIAELPPGRVRDSLRALLVQAQGDLDKFNAGVEHWFDDAMDRLSGAYKRFCGYFLLAFGVVIAVGFNVDSLAIAEFLWLNPQAAALLADQAQAATAAAPAASDVAAGPAQAVAQLQAGAVPFGWGPGVHIGPMKLLGWSATALAVSLGAPFWFDMLSRLLNIRSAGPKPKRSEDS